MNGLKKLRKYKGLSQQEVGKRAGIGQHRVSLLERGLKARPEEIEKLKEVLLSNETIRKPN